MSENMTRELKLDPREDFDRLQNRSFALGAVFTAAALAWGLTREGEAAADFYRAYLIGWLFVLGVAMGLFAIGMLNHLSGGRWGLRMRRVHEASGRTLPFVLILGAPILLGLKELYPWAEETPHVPFKAFLLNPTAFVVGSVGVVLLWSLFAYAISSYSRRHDETGDPGAVVAMQRLSAGGVVLYVLTGTVVSVQWIMSLDPDWFSSLFGFSFVAGQGLSAFAFMIPVMVFLSKRKPFAGFVPSRLFHDYGKLILAFVAVWAYFTVSQFLIIWSGNMPEEITWYIARSTNGWQAATVFLVLGHFAGPFILLLSQDLKKDGRRLVWVAAWVLLMRWYDLYWHVSPKFTTEGHFPLSFVDLLVPVGLGGLWLGLLTREFKRRSPLPAAEPAFEEVLAHG